VYTFGHPGTQNGNPAQVRKDSAVRLFDGVLVQVVLVLLPASLASAQTPPPKPKIILKGVTVEGRKNGSEFAVGNTIVVTLEDGSLEALKQAATPNNAIGLFLNGLLMKGLDARPDINDTNALKFQLQYTKDNKDAWSQLFGRKIGASENGDKVLTTVGLSDGSLFATLPQTLTLEFLPDLKAKIILGVSLLVVIATVIVGIRTPMLRDSGAPRTDQELGAFSLGRTQMALWFVTIVFAFLFIYAVTGVAPPIAQGALILMGIGAGTALGAASIDDNKKTASNADLVRLSAEKLTLEQKIAAFDLKKPADDDPALPVWRTEQQDTKDRLGAVIAQLAPIPDPQVPKSEGLIKDLLMDVNGISFHRLQMAAWTLVFWVLFLSWLFGNLTMMDFDATQLSLIGISRSTYLGFKLNEKQA
jgi:hypothetical protein